MRLVAMLRWRRVEAASIALGIAGLLVGCSVLMDFDTDQCTTDDECKAIAENAVCRDNACVTAPGTGGAGGGAAECTTNTECSAGQHAACRGGKCVPLLNEYCTHLIPADSGPISDDAFLVGFLNPFSGLKDFLGPLNLEPIELARHEFEKQQQGLLFPGSDVRPIVVVGCDEIDTIIEEGPPVHDAVAAVRHFADLEIPFAVGPNSTESAVLIREEAVKNKIMFLSGNADGVALGADFADDSLIWSTYPSVIDELAAVPQLVAAVEAQVRQDLGMGPAGNCSANATKDNPDCVRVAFIYREDADGTIISGKINELIRPNGLAAGANGDAFLPLGYTEENLVNAVTATLSLEPHIIIIVGQQDLVALDPRSVTYIPAVEDGWTNAAYRPQYIGTTAVLLPELPATVVEYSTGDHPYDLRLRIRGVSGSSFLRTSPVLQNYRLAFQGFHKKAAGFFTEHWYDAFYAGMYAITGAHNAPELNGIAVAEGMRTLNHEEIMTKLEVGAVDLQDASGYALNGTPFNLDGASGPLHFDTSTGFTFLPPVIPIWCLNANWAMIASAQSYDVQNDELVGEFDFCEGMGGSGGAGGAGGGAGGTGGS